MNPKTKRSQADKIRRRLTHLLAPQGFTRTKTSLWIRRSGPVAQFIHLHLYSFTTEFRAHLGVRVLNDPFSALALNGPDSHGLGFNLEYDETEESVVRCAVELSRYCSEVGDPWFGTWLDPKRLVEDPASPLNPEARRALALAVQGDLIETNVRTSNVLLGAA